MREDHRNWADKIQKLHDSFEGAVKTLLEAPKEYKIQAGAACSFLYLYTHTLDGILKKIHRASK